METTEDEEPRSRDLLIRESKDHIAIDVIELCRQLSIRAMLGGGPVLISHGLMSPAVGRFVSILVDPASIRHLHRTLVERGWTDVAPARRLRVLPSARLILRHDDEAAGLILYSVIPGFYADPEETFDLIWERHKEIRLRGQTIRALGRISSAILASHDGLDGHVSHQRSNFDYFVQQFRVLLDERERAVLGDFIRQIGACAEMAHLLSALDLKPCGFVLPSVPYVQWRLQVTDVSEQLQRAVALLELAPHGRQSLYDSKSGRPRSAHDYRVIVTSLPRTFAAVFGSRRRWRRTFSA
ncbi:MAG TPA: hypothetical protein VGM94_12550 [Galbitalea sp.]|jgi:hypothetical protein